MIMSKPTHVLIVAAVCGTKLEDLGYETFEGHHDSEWTIYAMGSKAELEALIGEWETRLISPGIYPSFTAYQTAQGFEIGFPCITKIGASS